MTIENIVKATMAKEIEDKLNCLDLTSIADKKLERHIKKFIKNEMSECIKKEISFAVKQYVDSWQGKREIANVIASMIKVYVKEEK